MKDVNKNITIDREPDWFGLAWQHYGDGNEYSNVSPSAIFGRLLHEALARSLKLGVYSVEQDIEMLNFVRIDYWKHDQPLRDLLKPVALHIQSQMDKEGASKEAKKAKRLEDGDSMDSLLKQIIKTYRGSGFSQTKTAAKLGIARSTVQRRLKIAGQRGMLDQSNNLCHGGRGIWKCAQGGL
jgi:DNA-binding protein Fis